MSEVQLEVLYFDVPGTGRVAYPCPVIDDDWPSEVKDALMRRRLATVTGRCVCGASAWMPSRADRRAAKREGRVLHTVWEHEADCTAGDEMLLPILHRHGLIR